jgi:demethylmenaquinone methyltransferase/2-methoxy-6-polyprenyl-1,4-benzoquinol methylase
MRWLEGSPDRYDSGMRVLTLGRVSLLHAAVAAAAASKPGDRVLEIGCGTGSVTALLLARGARVTALDQSPEMLEQARARVASSASSSVTWLEQTASEIDRLPEAGFEAVVLCLCLSDMSSSERAFVLEQAARRLSPGGRLIAADEVQAPAGWKRALQLFWRIPQAAIAWLLVGTVSRPVGDLPGQIRLAGLEIVDQRDWLMGTLALVTAERPR